MFRLQSIFEAPNATPGASFFLPERPLLCVGSDSNVEVYDVVSRSRIATLSGSAHITHMARVPPSNAGSDGAIVAASSDGTLSLWDAETFQVRVLLHASKKEEHRPVVGLVTRGPINFEDQKQRIEIDNENENEDEAQQQPIILYAREGDKNVKVISAGSGSAGQLLMRLEGARSPISCIACNDTHFAAGEGVNVRVWDSSGNVLCILEDFADDGRREVRSLTFGSDGLLVATGDNGRIVAWRLQTEAVPSSPTAYSTVIASYIPNYPADVPCNTLVVSHPTLHCVLTLSADGWLRAWKRPKVRDMPARLSGSGLFSPIRLRRLTGAIAMHEKLPYIAVDGSVFVVRSPRLPLCSFPQTSFQYLSQHASDNVIVYADSQPIGGALVSHSINVSKGKSSAPSSSELADATHTIRSLPVRSWPRESRVVRLVRSTSRRLSAVFILSSPKDGVSDLNHPEAEIDAEFTVVSEDKSDRDQPPRFFAGRDGVFVGSGDDRMLTISANGKSISVHPVSPEGADDAPSINIPFTVDRIFNGPIGVESVMYFSAAKKRLLSSGPPPIYSPTLSRGIHLAAGETVLSVVWGKVGAVLTSKRILLISKQFKIITTIDLDLDLDLTLDVDADSSIDSNVTSIAWAHLPSPPSISASSSSSALSLGQSTTTRDQVYEYGHEHDVLLFTTHTSLMYATQQGSTYRLGSIPSPGAILSCVLEDRVALTCLARGGRSVVRWMGVGFLEAAVRAELSAGTATARKHQAYTQGQGQGKVEAMIDWVSKMSMYDRSRLSTSFLKQLSSAGHAPEALGLSRLHKQRYSVEHLIGLALAAGKVDDAWHILSEAHKEEASYPALSPHSPLRPLYRIVVVSAVDHGEHDLAMRALETLGDGWAQYWMLVSSHQQRGLKLVMDRANERWREQGGRSEDARVLAELKHACSAQLASSSDAHHHHQNLSIEESNMSILDECLNELGRLLAVSNASAGAGAGNEKEPFEGHRLGPFIDILLRNNAALTSAILESVERPYTAAKVVIDISGTPGIARTEELIISLLQSEANVSPVSHLSRDYKAGPSAASAVAAVYVGIVGGEWIKSTLQAAINAAVAEPDIVGPGGPRSFQWLSALMKTLAAAESACPARLKAMAVKAREIVGKKWPGEGRAGAAFILLTCGFCNALRRPNSMGLFAKSARPRDRALAMPCLNRGADALEEIARSLGGVGDVFQDDREAGVGKMVDNVTSNDCSSSPWLSEPKNVPNACRIFSKVLEESYTLISRHPAISVFAKDSPHTFLRPAPGRSIALPAWVVEGKPGVPAEVDALLQPVDDQAQLQMQADMPLQIRLDGRGEGEEKEEKGKGVDHLLNDLRYWTLYDWSEDLKKKAKAEGGHEEEEEEEKLVGEKRDSNLHSELSMSRMGRVISADGLEDEDEEEGGGGGGEGGSEDKRKIRVLRPMSDKEKEDKKLKPRHTHTHKQRPSLSHVFIRQTIPEEEKEKEKERESAELHRLNEAASKQAEATANEYLRAGVMALEKGDFTHGVLHVKKCIVELVSAPNRGEALRSQIKLAVAYYFALSILAHLKAERPNDQQYAILTKILSDIPLKQKHHGTCVRMAVTRNMAVGNYGVASRLLEIMLSRVPPSKAASVKEEIATCASHDYQDSGFPVFNCPVCQTVSSGAAPRCATCGTRIRFCYDQWTLITTRSMLRCDVCDAVFNLGVREGKACTVCDVGVLKEEGLQP